MCRSVPQIPVMRTRTRTSLMPGWGAGTSSSHKPFSARLFTRAFIWASILQYWMKFTIKTQTDGTGDYASPPLRPGSYKVVAEAQGFKTQTRSSIALRVQDRLRIDFDMAVGSVSENIVVTGETPIIQTETSSLGQVV